MKHSKITFIVYDTAWWMKNHNNIRLLYRAYGLKSKLIKKADIFGNHVIW